MAAHGIYKYWSWSVAMFHSQLSYTIDLKLWKKSSAVKSREHGDHSIGPLRLIHCPDKSDITTVTQFYRNVGVLHPAGSKTECVI
jgi:hypothetical protein